MKNVHLIPTTEHSRLGYLTKKGKDVFNDLRLFDRLMPNIWDSENQHLYITDRNYEFGEGWYYNTSPDINKAVFAKIEDIEGLKTTYGGNPSHLEKITITTDPKLIDDGIQSISDEFLEWFVDNSSCEYVAVINWNNTYNIDNLGYEIIYPTERKEIDDYRIEKEMNRTIDELKNNTALDIKLEIEIQQLKLQQLKMHNVLLDIELMLLQQQLDASEYNSTESTRYQRGGERSFFAAVTRFFAARFSRAGK